MEVLFYPYFIDGRIKVQTGWEMGPMCDNELIAEQGLELRCSGLRALYSFDSDYTAVWWEDGKELTSMTSLGTLEQSCGTCPTVGIHVS